MSAFYKHALWIFEYFLLMESRLSPQADRVDSIDWIAKSVSLLYSVDTAISLRAPGCGMTGMRIPTSSSCEFLLQLGSDRTAEWLNPNSDAIQENSNDASFGAKLLI